MQFAESEKKRKKLTKYKEVCASLKQHCSVLQESLELSERIRVRQKTLLQKLRSKETRAKNVASKSVQIEPSDHRSLENPSICEQQSIELPRLNGTMEQESSKESSQRLEEDSRTKVRSPLKSKEIIRKPGKSNKSGINLSPTPGPFSGKPPIRVQITESSQQPAETRANRALKINPGTKKHNADRPQAAFKQRFLEPTKASLQHRVTAKVARQRIPFRV